MEITRRALLAAGAAVTIPVAGKANTLNITSKRFAPLWSGTDSAMIYLTVSGIPAGAVFETAVTNWTGQTAIIPWEPTTSTGQTQHIPRICPAGGPYVGAVRWNGSLAYTTSNEPAGICVGEVTAIIGQSNGHLFCTAGGNVPSRQDTVCYDRTGAIVAGQGVTQYLNDLAVSTGIPQAGLAASVASTALTVPGYEAHSAQFGDQNGCWLSDAGGVWSGFVQACSTMENRIHRVVQIGHESDTILVSQATYEKGLATLQKRVDSVAIEADPRWYIPLLGKYPVQNADTGPVRAAQTAFAASGAATLGPDCEALPVDATGIHYTAEGCRMLGEQLAPIVHQNELA